MLRVARHPARRALTLAALACACVLGLPQAAPAADVQGLHAEYFEDTGFTGSVLTRIDAVVDFRWGAGEPAFTDDTFAVRWTGRLLPRHTETYTFTTTSDDIARLTIDGTVVVEDWSPHAEQEATGTADLVAGREHEILVEFADGYGDGVMRLEWQSASQVREVVPASRLRPPAAAPPAGATPSGTGTAPQAGLPVAPGDPLGPPPAEALGDTAVPAPVAGRRFTARPARGEILVTVPGGAAVPLSAAGSIPNGAIVDARHGELTLETAAGRGVAAATQRARLRGGPFRVTQRPRGDRAVALDLTAGAGACRRSARHTTARAAAVPRPKRRRLWAEGKGRFSTRGRSSVATVRGTGWSVADGCAGTITHVRHGVVAVRDLKRRRTVVLRRGDRYVARR